MLYANEIAVRSERRWRERCGDASVGSDERKQKSWDINDKKNKKKKEAEKNNKRNRPFVQRAQLHPRAVLVTV